MHLADLYVLLQFGAEAVLSGGPANSDGEGILKRSTFAIEPVMPLDWSALLQTGAKLGLLGLALVAFCLLVQIVYLKVKFGTIAPKDGPKVIIVTLVIGAVVFICTIGAWLVSLFVPEPTRNVDVVIKNQGSILRKDFVVVYSIPDRGKVRESGKVGYAEIRGVPRAKSFLRLLDVECPDYASRNRMPADFPITDDKVEVEMIGDTPADPQPIDDYPNASERVPPKEAVFQPPKIDPTKVIFKYKNATGKDGRLALYSCTAHYEPLVDAATIRPKWLELPFPASADDKIYESFRTGHGWFVIYFQPTGSDKMGFCRHKKSV